MKFESEKSALVALVVFSIAAVITTLLLTDLLYHSGKGIVFPLVMLLPVGFLLWIWFSTSYEISGGFLHYQSGPFKGRIEISSIRVISKCSSFKVIGLKPALNTNGLLIAYNKYDELFISPENKKDFIAALHQYNPEIMLKFETNTESGNSPDAI
jgi:hypothetical protein